MIKVEHFTKVSRRKTISISIFATNVKTNPLAPSWRKTLLSWFATYMFCFSISIIQPDTFTMALNLFDVLVQQSVLLDMVCK